jgi:aromatic-L-amino-acid decarboxylase
MDYGVQLGRKFRALKAWMVFRTFGRAGMAARIREHLRLTCLLADWVEQDARFELAAPVSMAVICFRVRNSDPETADRLNRDITERVNASGEAYVNQTKLNGRTAIRVGLGNVLTTEKHLRRVWDLIQLAADDVAASEEPNPKLQSPRKHQIPSSK